MSEPVGIDLTSMMNESAPQESIVATTPVVEEQPAVNVQQTAPTPVQQKAKPVAKVKAKSQDELEAEALNIDLEKKLIDAHKNVTIVDSVTEVRNWDDKDVDNCPVCLRKLSNDDFKQLLDLLSSINQAQDFTLKDGYVCNEIVGDIMVIDVRDKNLPDYLDLSEFNILHNWLKTASDGFKLDIWLKVQKVAVNNRVQTYMTYITPVSMQSLMSSGINVGEGNIAQYHNLAEVSKKVNGDIKSFTIPYRQYKIIKPIIGLYKSYPFLKNEDQFGDKGLFIYTQNASNNKESETKIFDRDVFEEAGYDISNNVKFSKTSFEFPFESDVIVEIYPMFENDNISKRKFTALMHSTIKGFDVKLLYIGSLSQFSAPIAANQSVTIDTLVL